MSRENLLHRLWADSPLFLPFEDFARSMEGWSIEPVEQGGRTIGVFTVKGAEIHFQKFDDTPAAKAHLVRLAEVIREHGHAITRTPKEDERQLRFNRRLGFYPISEGEFDIVQRIDTMRSTKEAPCP